MSERIEQGAVKVIEIIGISNESFEDAVQQGIAKASESIKGITGVEVMKTSAKVSNGKVSSYHANMKVAFGVK